MFALSSGEPAMENGSLRYAVLTGNPFFFRQIYYILQQYSFVTKRISFMKKQWVTACALMLVAGMSVYGQEVSAGITGRVTDPSGSAIVGAKVNAKDMDRGT